MRYWVLWVATLLGSGLWGASCAAPPGQNIRVVLRYDDVSGTSSLALEKELVARLKSHGIPCTFGVIPFVAGTEKGMGDFWSGRPLPEEKIAFLKDALSTGLIEIAQHGYNHRSIRPGPYKTEFSTLPMDIQDTKIRRGRELLERHFPGQIKTFIPPHNRYDLNTVEALERVGLQNISADTGGIASWTSSLNFLPATCHLREIKSAVAAARRTSDRRPVIVALFHGYDISGDDHVRGTLSMAGLDHLLQWLASQKDVRGGTINSVIEEGQDFHAGRYRENYACLEILRRVFPDRVLPIVSPRGVYLSGPVLAQRSGMIQTVLIMMYGVILAGAFNLSQKCSCKMEGWDIKVRCLVKAAAVVSWFYLLTAWGKTGGTGWPAAVMLTALSGGLAGMIWPLDRPDVNRLCKRQNFALSRPGDVIQ